jgi:hypothetical protein
MLRKTLFTFIFSVLTLYHLRAQTGDGSPRDSAEIDKKKMAWVLGSSAVVYSGLLSYLHFIWYTDVPRAPFHFYNDSKGYNQIDKLGHAYGAYLEGYVGMKAFRWAGVNRKKAAWYGATMGFMLQLPIEIWDGIHEGWGFSMYDVGANTVGALLLVGNEYAFGEQRLLYKFSFSRSPYAKMANGYLGNGFDELFNDYNGHSYWLSYGLRDLTGIKKIPQWLNLAVGYGAGGMFGEFENRSYYDGVALPEVERYRRFMLSLDVNFAKIPTRNRFLKTILNNMFVVKMPLPTLIYNSKGEWRMHGIYY